MTKQLVLMRHAKSDPAGPGMDDHDRPLDDLGRRAAPGMAAWLARHHAMPDAILASTARRVEETVQALLDQWRRLGAARQPQVHATPRLYLASAETILSVIRSDSLGLDSLMVVGHNPGLEDLVGRWSDRPEPFPTAAMAVFAVKVDDWSRFSLGSPCQCVALARPRELADEASAS